MASDILPDIGAKIQSFAGTIIQGTTDLTESVSKFFRSESTKISNEADSLLKDWSTVFASKREQEETDSKPTIKKAGVWEDILLSATLGKHQIDLPDPSAHEKAHGDAKEATAEQVVPPPAIDFSLEDLKSDIKAREKTAQVSAFHDLQGKELEETCASALQLLTSIDTGDDVSRTRKDFVRKVFWNVPDDKFHRFEGRARKEAEQNSRLTLKCKVIRGNGLTVKDPKKQHELYILLGIVPQRTMLEGKKGQPVHLDTLKKESVVAEIFTATSREVTASPTWNETFELMIPNRSEGCLVVEVWLSKIEAEKSGKKKSMGFGKLLNRSGESGDFVAGAVHSLQSVGMDGKELALELSTHSSKKPQGTITVKLDMYSSQVEKISHVKLEDYCKLVQAVVAYESIEDGERVKRWRGQLSSTAVNLLSAYCSIFKFTQLQQTAVLLSELLDYHNTYTVQMTVFEQLIAEVQKSTAELERMCSLDPVPGWVTHLLDNLKELWTNIVEFLNYHLVNTDFKQSYAVRRLEGYLLSLRNLHNTTAFVRQKLAQEEQNYQLVVGRCIKVSVFSCFSVFAGRVAEVEGAVQRIRGFKVLLEHFLEECNTIKTTVQPVFLNFDVDYFSSFFVTLEELLEQEAGTYLNNCPEEGILATYEVYHVMKKFVPIAKPANPSILSTDKTEHAVGHCHQWFHQLVKGWIQIALDKARKRIEQAIRLDEMKEVTESVTFSSSAVDTDLIFAQVASFLKELAWPDRDQSYSYYITTVEGLCKLALFYAETVNQKVEKEMKAKVGGKLSISEEGFSISDKVCILLNSIEHVRQVLQSIPELLQLTQFMQWLDSKEELETTADTTSTQKFSDSVQKLVHELLASADEDMQNKLAIQVNSIVRKLSFEITAYFPRMSAGPDTEKAMEPLLNYIEENMVKLGKTLLTPIFLSILEDLWLDVLQALKHEHDKLTQLKPTSWSGPKNTHLYERLWEALELLRQFFHAGGGGLSDQKLHNEEYKDLASKLDLARLAGDQLERRFLLDLSKQEFDPKRSLGTIHFSHRYIEDKQKIDVDVIFAEDLGNDKLDPYVELMLLPKKSFPTVRSEKKKTSFKKLTSKPMFNESFQLSAKKSEMRDGSLLLLVVYDHYTIGADDFVGMCTLNCACVPSGSERKMEHMPLFQFSDVQCKSLQELESRSEDLAVELCKLMKTFVVPEKPLDKLMKEGASFADKLGLHL